MAFSALSTARLLPLVEPRQRPRGDRSRRTERDQRRPQRTAVLAEDGHGRLDRVPAALLEDRVDRFVAAS